MMIKLELGKGILGDRKVGVEGDMVDTDAVMIMTMLTKTIVMMMLIIRGVGSERINKENKLEEYGEFEFLWEKER